MKNWREKGRMIRSKEKEHRPSQRPYGSRQDDGDTGDDDDVSSDDNTDILSSL